MDQSFFHLDRLLCALERLAAAPCDDMVRAFAHLPEHLSPARGEVKGLLDYVKQEKKSG